ncbi:MAG: DNA repair protein RecO [Clostridiales bacterium]|nr:DNA repair protein RecO [Clostridiales bacterium]
MVRKLTLTGMVLSATPVNDYDKRLVILTKDRGKIVAFAKGARRPHSQYIAGSRPFSFGEFSLYEGKTAYNLCGINISNYFEDVSADIESVYYGFYFLEMADYFSTENVEAKVLLNLLYISLKALEKKVIPRALIRHIFELRCFAINGEYPNVFQCVSCGESDDIHYFSTKKSGALCSKCGAAQSDAIVLNTSTFYTMQYIISSKLEKLYSFNVSDEVLSELGMVMRRWMTAYVDKGFKSEELISLTANVLP